jgi:hypothetical protein
MHKGLKEGGGLWTFVAKRLELRGRRSSIWTENYHGAWVEPYNATTRCCMTRCWQDCCFTNTKTSYHIVLLEKLCENTQEY